MIWNIINFNPKLIIQIACKFFYHRELFIIDTFPRIVIQYDIKQWTKEPIIILSKEIKEIKKLFTLLSKGLKNKKLTRKENTRYMEIVKYLTKKNIYKNNHQIITDNYKDTMQNIFNFILNNQMN